MADSLFEDILGMLGQKGIDNVAKETGSDRKKAEAATGAAVGALLEGLANNAKDQSAAEEMLERLRRDHANFDPGQIEVETRRMSPEQTSEILRHIFGGKQAKVERQLGNASGVGQDGMAKILKGLAPIVLGMLAKRGGERNVQSGPDLSRWLGQQKEDMQKKPEIGILGSLLDQDHDGDVDIGDMAGVLGKMLGGAK